MKKLYLLLITVAMMFCLASCEKKYTTVADDITLEESGESGYKKIDSFKLKTGNKKDLPEIGYCAILIPDGFVESDTIKGMYISNVYPLKSSNIYYSVFSAEEDGYIKDNLTSEEYEVSIENAHKSLGSDVDLIIDSFELTQIESIPCYMIRSHYEKDGNEVQQLTYIVVASDTHVITYTQASDDELLMDFTVDEGTIKLVREVSEAD